MQHCYTCGVAIPEGQATRRFVTTGRSSSLGFFGKRLGAVESKRTGMRTLCRTCAARVGPGWGTYIVGGVLILFVLRACFLPYEPQSGASNRPVLAAPTASSVVPTVPAEDASNQAPKTVQVPPLSDAKRKCLKRAFETNSDMAQCK